MNGAAKPAMDWLGKSHTNIIAWWIPKGTMVAGLLAPVPLRATIWIAALAWMGIACILNSRRCRRTHCRYTGPFYLMAIVPVALLGSGVLSANFYGWLALGLVILPGGWVIWWATERAWGKFS